MSEYTKSLSYEQVANMRDHFYKLGWGQNETMWECWNQALDYIAPQLSASQAREAELREKLAEQQAWILEIAKQARMVIPTAGQFDKLVSAIERIDATELRKLLESKVPEEVLIEIVTQAHMAGQFNQSQRDPSYYEARVYYGETQLSIRAMLAAAPQPNEPKQSPETDLDEAQRRQ